jgi:hypothetical protein
VLRGAQVGIQSKVISRGSFLIYLHVENVNNQANELNVNHAAAHAEISNLKLIFGHFMSLSCISKLTVSYSVNFKCSDEHK